MTFSTELKRWRVAHKLSQSQAAKALGVSTGVLQAWEQGRRTPKPLTVEAVRGRMKEKRFLATDKTKGGIYWLVSAFAPDSTAREIARGKCKNYEEIDEVRKRFPDCDALRDAVKFHH